MFFPVSARNWTIMEQVELNYDGQTAIFNGSRGINAPAEYSFHCQKVSSAQNPLLVPRTGTDNATRWSLLFTDFQVPSHFASVLFPVSPPQVLSAESGDRQGLKAVGIIIHRYQNWYLSELKSSVAPTNNQNIIVHINDE